MDIYNSTPKHKSGHKKLGLIALALWIFFVISFVFFINTYTGESNIYTNIVGLTTFSGSLLLLPVWGFLLGNKLVRILTILPFVLWAIFYLIYLLGFKPHKITGRSMEPDLNDREYMISEKVSYYSHSPKRGDIIVFTRNDRPKNEFIDRIVGLPGEYISIRNNHVYINNKILDEPYIDSKIVTKAGTYIGESNIFIPENSYAVLGDNREHSDDSRFYGFIEKSTITGKASYIYWPSDKKGFIKNPLSSF